MAVNSICLSIPELAKQEIQDLFSSKNMLTMKQWCTVIPKDMESLECTPSLSSKWYSRSDGCDENLRDYLGESFEQVFVETAHSESLWQDFSMNVTHKLGLTYREIKKMNGSMSSYSEAKLRHSILHPILKGVSMAVSIIPGIKHETIKIDYLIEDEIVVDKGKTGPGQKSAVDALIQVSDKENMVIALIPIEMKLEIDTAHYCQIACYMNKLSTAEDIRGFIMVGIIIDTQQFRLAFSGFSVVDEFGKQIPLPVVHISPPIPWRSESSGMIQEEAMLVLACTLFLVGKLKRQPFDLKKHHPYRVSATTLIDMGKRLLKTPYAASNLKQDRITSIKRMLEEQQKEMEEYKKEIEEHKKEIEELKQKVEKIENPAIKKQKTMSL